MENFFWQMNKKGENPSDLEKKHTAIIEVPENIKAGEPFEVKIKLGEIDHPIENDHFIQFVELYVHDLYVTRIDFTPVIQKPEATIKLILTKGGTLRAVARCNLHGLWESSVDLKIE